MINLLHLKPLEILCEGKLGETHFKFMTVLFEALMFRRRNKIINAMTSLLFRGILTRLLRTRIIQLTIVKAFVYLEK